MRRLGPHIGLGFQPLNSGPSAPSGIASPPDAYNPLSVGDVSCWFDPQDPTAYTINGGSVFTAATNKASSAAFEIVGSPTLSPTGINGRSAAMLPSGSMFRSFEAALVNAAANGADMTLACVAKALSITGTRYYAGWGGASGTINRVEMGVHSSGKWILSYSGTVADSPLSLVNGNTTPHLFLWRVTSGILSLEVDGTRVDLAANDEIYAPGTLSPFRFAIGCGPRSTTPSSYWESLIGDVLTANKSLTASEGAAWTEYLCEKYNVPMTLGATASALPNPVTAAPGETSLFFDGEQDWLEEQGSPDTGLNLTQWTLEAWIYVGDSGDISDTPPGDHIAYPIVARGPNNSGSNYWMGVGADGRLRGIFEGTVETANNTVTGIRTLKRHAWYHVAYTHDGATSAVYVNGTLDNSAPFASVPWFDVPPHPLAIGGDPSVAGGSSAGRFQGYIRDVRIWNSARSAAQIAADALQHTPIGPTSGLVREYLLTGAYFLTDSATPIINETPPGATGLPVEQHDSTAGGQALLQRGRARIDSGVTPPSTLDDSAIVRVVGPADLASVAGPTVEISARVFDYDDNTNTVEFWGRAHKSPEPFTIIALPDTQRVTESLPAQLVSSFQWIVDNHVALNNKAVLSLGDCVNVSNETQWTAFDSAVDLLDAAGIPYGHGIGNHDSDVFFDPDTTVLANTYFGPARFAGKPYYLGHHGTDNDNNAIRFQVSSAPDLYVTSISLEWDFDLEHFADVVTWARGIALTYPNDIVIICSHYWITEGNPGYPTPQWTAMYDAIKDLSHVKLMLSGHISQSSRSDTYAGNTIHTVMADYQLTSGSFFVRRMRFELRDEEVIMSTYNVIGVAEVTDALSAFRLPIKSPGAPEYELLGTVSGVPSGWVASFDWSGLTAGNYEWFARAKNGTVYRDSERRGFIVT